MSQQIKLEEAIPMYFSSKHRCPSLLLFLLFLLAAPPAYTLASTLLYPPKLQTPASACLSTQYPKLCRRLLRTFPSNPTHIQTYTLFSLKQSLRQALIVSGLIRSHSASASTYSTINSNGDDRNLPAGALDDCLELSQLTVDDLERVSDDMEVAGSAWEYDQEKTSRAQTLLSAAVTNQQSCSDGLQEAAGEVPEALSRSLANATDLYTISLQLLPNGLQLSYANQKQRPTSAANNHFNKVWSKVMASGDERSRAKILEGVKIMETVSVSQSGRANFTTIGEAVKSAADKTDVEVDGYYVIYVQEGVYQENVVVPKHKKYIMMIGDGINRTVIAGNRSAAQNWTTYNSATLAVAGDGFAAIDITFRNTAGPESHQAVAMRSSADFSVFYRCSFEGFQDTLYTHSKRQFYRECDIYGTVDFIFGNAASVFQKCRIYARKPLPDQKNTITAQGRTLPSQNTGFSIHNCSILPSPDLAAAENSSHSSSFLGRPWKPYARTVFMQSFIDGFVDPKGWLEWNATQGVDNIYYGEFENYGPGSNTGGRILWPGYFIMNVTDAVRFTVCNFTLGDTWLTHVNVPFDNGLL